MASILTMWSLSDWNLWRRYSGIPETFHLLRKVSEVRSYPLRPEFIESNYHLYRVTRDDLYLEIGRRVLRDLERRAKVECGVASIKDLDTGELEDRMESFALSETLKVSASSALNFHRS